MPASMGAFPTVVALVGSMTQAQRAQKALWGAAIRAEIVKQDEIAHRGCGYGVSFPASHQANARAILDAAHIPVRRYVQGE